MIFLPPEATSSSTGRQAIAERIWLLSCVDGQACGTVASVEVHVADGKQIVRDSTPTEKISPQTESTKSDVIKAVDGLFSTVDLGCNVCIWRWVQCWKCADQGPKGFCSLISQSQHTLLAKIPPLFLSRLGAAAAVHGRNSSRWVGGCRRAVVSYDWHISGRSDSTGRLFDGAKPS